VRPWHFAVLWLALFVTAMASGIDLLYYLSYLVLFVGVTMWIVSRQTLEGLTVKRQIGQAYAHLGDTIELRYELFNAHRFGKLWLEISWVRSCSARAIRSASSRRRCASTRPP
jgi:hypothetical protein